VFVHDLGLAKDEQHVFIEMVGKRFNQGKKEVTLTADRFPNRIENKRYLIVVLENLVSESKRIAALPESK
jgi:small subunit ribosomal protein S35